MAELDKPAPNDDEVLVKVLAASVNAADWLIMRGQPLFSRATLGFSRATLGLLRPKHKILGLDVAGQVELAARVRLPGAGDVNKNDPNDARSVAVAALRSKAQRQVAADGHAAVLKIWAKRHRDLARSRNQVACRLHAVLCELVSGGFAGESTAGLAARVLDQVTPDRAAAAARRDLATEFLADLRRPDAQRRGCAKKLAAAVRACGTCLTGLSGVGPVIAGLVIGDIPDATRFPRRSHFAACNGTAPAGVLRPPSKSHWPGAARRPPASAA